MAKRKWIKGAIKRPGSFTRKARRAGMGVQAYAAKVRRGGPKRYGLRTYRQAVLARTLKRIGKRRRR